jgi:protein phosphatase
MRLSILDLFRPTEASTVIPARTFRPLVCHSHGSTDPGRVRPANEDRFAVVDLWSALAGQSGSDRAEEPAEAGQLLIVADGMGGHAGGQRASSLAVAVLTEYLLDALSRLPEPTGEDREVLFASLPEAVKRTDERVIAEANRCPELHGMGTTVTLACILGNEATIAHVGDSRCYLFRGGSLRQVTRDHSMAQEMLRLGMIQPHEAGTHPWRHIITNAVGAHEPGVDVEMHHLQLVPGDRLLLCSDGLTDMVPDETLATVLREEPNPARASERLVALANTQGGRDNITVVIARFDEAQAG